MYYVNGECHCSKIFFGPDPLASLLKSYELNCFAYKCLLIDLISRYYLKLFVCY